jgi:predicted MFS family arabinose efflux permease
MRRLSRPDRRVAARRSVVMCQDGAGKAAVPLSRADIAVMALACGLAVATLYYNQPLLPQMGAAFGRPPAETTIITTVTQFGYTAGLLFCVPLGDTCRRKQLVCGLAMLNIAALISTALAQSYAILLFSSFAIGMTTVSAQIVIPALASRATRAERGRVTGTLLSGLSAGLLFARAFSGFVGAHGGWRLMFVLAAIIDAILIAILWLRLPDAESNDAIAYPQLIGSLWRLVRTEPILRAACVTGFLMFAAFSALWGSLAGLLSLPPYRFGPDIAGDFGFIAIVGMSLSPLIGRLVDHHGSGPVLTAGAVSLLAAFLLVSGSAKSLIWLVAGAALIDVGSRAGVIANQARIYALSEAARSRLNTVFMTSFFLGGSIGTAVAAEFVARLGWTGLAIAGGGFALAACVAHRLTATACG